jgi:phosphatidylglycerophosphatase A
MRNLGLAATLFTATGAGSGYAPVAPGTVGSLVGLGLYVLCVRLGGQPGLLIGLALAVALGTWAADRAGHIFGTHDDGRITVDEVAGMLLALVWLPALPWVMASGFLLFRLFDIWKPWPARLAESLPGGVGVMADDLVAGVYANLVGQLLWRLALPALSGGSA